jgi:hypothetical protein
MAGLSLNVGGYGAGRAQSSSGVPMAANAPSSNIAQRAYGIQEGQAGSRVPAYGSVGLGLLGAAVLIWLWVSLPR